MQTTSIRPGAALLEVIVAVTLLAAGGLSVSGLIARSVHHLNVARAHEREIREASTFMDAVSLWTRDDLDRRLGRRPQGQWFLNVGKNSRTLYSIELTHADSSVLIKTNLFRP